MTTFLRDDLGYLNSRQYAMSLIQYPDGRPRANDIDFISFKNDFIILGECKNFVCGKNEFWIDPTKYSMFNALADIIQKDNRKIFYVGTDSYGCTKPTDLVWAITHDSVASGETPSTTCSGSIILQKENMIPYTREAFSELGNHLLDHFGNKIKSVTFKILR